MTYLMAPIGILVLLFVSMLSFALAVFVRWYYLLHTSNTTWIGHSDSATIFNKSVSTSWFDFSSLRMFTKFWCDLIKMIKSAIYLWVERYKLLKIVKTARVFCSGFSKRHWRHGFCNLASSLVTCAVLCGGGTLL